MSNYEVKAGPEAFLPPAAASMGNVLPDPGEAHIGGKSEIPNHFYFESNFFPQALQKS